MFDWLFEGHKIVFLTLIVAGLILAGLWYRDRKRHWLYPLTGVVLILGLYWLLDVLVETTREEITRRLGAIAVAVRAQQGDRVLDHVSPSFDYRGVRFNKFRDSVRTNLQTRFVDDLVIWDITFKEDVAKVAFRAKPRGQRIPDTPGFPVTAEFVKDPDGGWRMRTFEVFNVLVDQNQPLDIRPYLP